MPLFRHINTSFAFKSLAALCTLLASSLFIISASSLMLQAQAEPALEQVVLPQNQCEFSGTFEQVKKLDPNSPGLNSNGVFYHHCQHGVIWSTQSPITETLVMRRDNTGFIITEQGQKKLKSRQGKFLSRLLNDLMSGNQSAIEAQFTLKENDGIINLIPNKRSLKRAIQYIDVNFNNDASQVGIVIVDRNAQRIEINSTMSSAFRETSAPQLNCESLIYAPSLCTLLLDTPPNT